MTTIDGFLRRRVAANGITLSVQEAGTGPALILLHGYPQNGMCWAKVAPALARHFRVLIPDLRGYGQSDAPPDDVWHSTYSKRTMARDITGMMDALGITRADVLGHDRGARVAYRLALDAPERVSRLGIIEILPTADYWAHWDAGLGMAAYHWTFLAQPAPLPEKMIGADPVFYIDWTLRSWTRAKSLHAFPPDSLASYHAQARDPAPTTAPGPPPTARWTRRTAMRGARSRHRCISCGPRPASPRASGSLPRCGAPGPIRSPTPPAKAAISRWKRRPTRCWPPICRSLPPYPEALTRSTEAAVSPGTPSTCARCTPSSVT